MLIGKSLNGVDAELRERVERLLTLVPSAWVESAFRTYAQQEVLYKAYKAGGTLAAKPGTSMHERGLAVDVDCLPADNALRARVAKQCGLVTPIKGEPWHMQLDPNRRPLDSQVIPSITITNHGEVQLAKTITFSNVQLDNDGNGWVPLDVPVGKIGDIRQLGSFPPADGYWRLCLFGKQMRVMPGMQSIIQIGGGSKKQVITFWVEVNS